MGGIERNNNNNSMISSVRTTALSAFEEGKSEKGRNR
jgi:hypothetical protein